MMGLTATAPGVSGNHSAAHAQAANGAATSVSPASSAEQIAKAALSKLCSMVNFSKISQFLYPFLPIKEQLALSKISKEENATCRSYRKLTKKEVTHHKIMDKEIQEVVKYALGINTLWLSCGELRDLNSLTLIASLKHLTSLHLGGYSQLIDGDALSILTSLTQLSTLALPECGATGAGLKHLSCFTKLQMLYLGHNAFNRNSLLALTSIPSLNTLHLESVKITSEILKILRVLTQVRSLNLKSAKLGYDSFGGDSATLSSFTHLESLSLEKVKVTNDVLISLTFLEQLRVLNLDQATLDADVDLSCLTHLTNLTTLQLRYSKLNDNNLTFLRSFARLHTLFLSGSRVTHASLTQLALLPTLRMLDFGSYNLPVDSLTHFTHFTQLHTLYLWCPLLTDDKIKNLASLTQLKCLDPTRCNQLTKKGINRIRHMLPGARVDDGIFDTRSEETEEKRQ